MTIEKVTSLQVAKKAGVSQSAVSRVFTPGASASRATIDKVKKAANDLGMRISTGGIFFDYPGIGNRSHEDFLQEAEKFFEDYNSNEAVFPGVMPHGTYTVSPKHLKEAKKIAERHNGLYHIHAAETLAELSDIS